MFACMSGLSAGQEGTDMKLETRQRTAPDAPAPVSRRAALARLGLGVAVVYTAPTVLHLDRSVNAQIVPSPCTPSKGKKGKGAPSWCRRNPPSPHMP